MSQGRPVPTADFARFLEYLREVPNVTRAARLTGHEPKTFRKYRKTDPLFAAEWDEALQDGIDSLEAEAHRRAFEGIDKPVTFQGVITGTYKEYSDTMAMFLLKAHRPDKYRERSDVSVTGDVSLVERLARGRQRVGDTAAPDPASLDDGTDLVG